MAADITPRSVVEKWLIHLGLRCAPTKGAEDIELRLAEYTLSFARDVPERAFCDASLESLARQFEYFPSYAALRKALDKWLDDNKPRELAIASAFAPDSASMPPQDRHQVDAWLRAEARGTSDAELSGRLGVVRQVASAGFDWLVRSNPTAGAIALRRGWIADANPASMGDRMRDEWSDPSGITRRVAALTQETDNPALVIMNAPCVGLLAALVARYAPHHVHLVPDEIELRPIVAGAARQMTQQQRADMRADDGSVRIDPPPDRAQQFEAAHGRRAGDLTPEHLAKVREAAGIKIPVDPKPVERVLGARPPANDHATPPPASAAPFPWSSG